MFSLSCFCVFFAVSVHPVLHGNCGSRIIHSIPAHLSGHLLLLQVKTSQEFNLIFVSSVLSFNKMSRRLLLQFDDACYVTVVKMAYTVYPNAVIINCR